MLIHLLLPTDPGNPGSPTRLDNPDDLDGEYGMTTATLIVELGPGNVAVTETNLQ